MNDSRPLAGSGPRARLNGWPGGVQLRLSVRDQPSAEPGTAGRADALRLAPRVTWPLTERHRPLIDLTVAGRGA